MPDKTLTYVELARNTARQITSSYRSWTGYLSTASRLYKYPYSDQLLIHAQRPDATACAEYDLWNNTMRRYVRRGSKGFALLNTSGDQVSLRYVFDIADTGTRQSSRTPFVWTISAWNELAVTAVLEHEYGVLSDHGLSYQLSRIARQQADEYCRDHRFDILRIVDGSFLDGYDELNVEMSFRRAAAASISYVLHSRCGLDVESTFVHEDFLNVFDWNTPDAAAVLGTAVSQISGQVLRQIEAIARSVERSLENERNAVHEEGRLNTPANTTILSSIRLNGETAYTIYSGGTTREKFLDYLKNTLIPTLHEGDIVIMSSQERVHKPECKEKVGDTACMAG